MAFLVVLESMTPARKAAVIRDFKRAWEAKDFAFEVAGDRIKHIWAVRNPEKLRHWPTK